MKLAFGMGIGLGAALLLISCKTYRPNTSVRDVVANSAQKKEPTTQARNSGSNVTTLPDELPARNSLIISKFTFPSEVDRYDRSCVLLQRSGEPDLLIEDYKVGEPIDVEPFETYTLTIEVYRDRKLVFDNGLCEVSRSFSASLGRNIFAVPLCHISNESVSTSGCSRFE